MSNIIAGGDVAAAARTFLGYRWRHQGRSRLGVDCIGLVLLALTMAGWQPRDPRNAWRLRYPRAAEDESLRSILCGEGEPVALNSLQRGDVIVVHFASDQFPQHCGLVTGCLPQPQMIESSALHHRVVEAALDPLEAVGAFRICGVDPGAPAAASLVLTKSNSRSATCARRWPDGTLVRHGRLSWFDSGRSGQRHGLVHRRLLESRGAIGPGNAATKLAKNQGGAAQRPGHPGGDGRSGASVWLRHQPPRSYFGVGLGLG